MARAGSGRSSGGHSSSRSSGGHRVSSRSSDSRAGDIVQVIFNNRLTFS